MSNQTTPNPEITDPPTRNPTTTNPVTNIPGTTAHRAEGPGTHGSIRLIPDQCTSCMICARGCPTWCIRIDSHAEPLTDIAPGARTRTRNVLDRFEIDWALCMYCGICIDQCPFDALEWAGPHVAPAGQLVDLVHGAQRLAGGAGE